MIKRPSSRDSYTLFPAGHSTQSSVTSERMGAFGTLQLEEPPRSHTPTRHPSGHSRTHSNPQYAPIGQTRQLVPNGYYRQENTYSVEPMKKPVTLEMEQQIYHPTTVSNADTNETRRKYDKLSEVISTSDDTVQFAKNFNDYLNERIPYGFSITILCFLCIIAFVLTLVGALNIPFCPVQPMIPIWLMISGVLFIISATFRIVRLIPDGAPKRPPTPKNRKKKLSASLCVTGFELLFLFINLIWLILGAVWIYGSQAYVHFNDQMFEEHFCDSGIYWTAFSAVTGYLIFVCLLILALICLLFVGSCKEANASQDLE